MSQSFSKLIKANGRLHEFNFRRMPGTELRYHVDVPDSRGNRVIFYMFKEENAWKTSEKLPAWIDEAQQFLENAIEERETELAQFTKRKAS